jgi:hypothetical protein
MNFEEDNLMKDEDIDVYDMNQKNFSGKFPDIFKKKRSRPIHFSENNYNDNEDFMVFNNKSTKLKPFSNTVLRLPGFKKPNIQSSHFNNNNEFVRVNGKGVSIKDWRKMEYDAHKHEIRQLMNLNRQNKLKAFAKEKDINKIGRTFNPNVFVSGKKKRKKSWRKK